MKKVIEKARELALAEIKKTGLPILEHFNLANSKGQELAEKLGGDKEIILLGTMLMDLKLGECLREGKLPEHVRRSSDEAKKFLEKFKVDPTTKNKIINCIEAHHRTIPFTCTEAEICANADCYRFLHPRGILAYLAALGKRFDDLKDIFNQLELKMDEKMKTLTLALSKKELQPYYKSFKEYIKQARESA